MRRHFFLMYNPAAGTARGVVVDKVERDLVAGGGSVVRATAMTVEAAAVEARAAAQSGDFDALIAAGGDGTVRQAAIATLGTPCAVGAIMIGTGNVLAHELGLPRQAHVIATMLREGPSIPIELGRANGTPFLLMAGAGLDGRIIARLHQPLKRWIGKAAFAPATLAALAGPLDQIAVEIDGQAHTCTWAIVTNASYYGSTFRLTSAVSLRTPTMAVLLFRARSRVELATQVVALALGRLDARSALDPDWVSIHPCTRVRIEADPPTVVQIDGDLFGMTPVEITRNGGQIAMIVPRGP